jgi:6-phosphogluconolactonase
MKKDLRIFPTSDEVSAAAADYIIDIAKESITARGRFVISLSGGRTPEKLYSLLAKSPLREKIEWLKTFIFWTDERYVGFDDEQNNAHHIKLILLNKIDIPASNIHVINVNLQPDEAAMEYEKDIKYFFKNGPLRFDLILLGLGENGHTASLFPGTSVLNDQTKGIRSVYVEEDKRYRITMTAPLINQASHILFLVTGMSKNEMLRNTLTESFQPIKFPAQLIKPANGELLWFSDRKASS